MSPAAFLLIALVVGVLGSLVVVARFRQSQRPDHAMDEFRREMQALAPPTNPLVERRRRTAHHPGLPYRPSSERPFPDRLRRPGPDGPDGPRRDPNGPRSGAGSDAR